MGMTDKQFQSWVRFLLAMLKDYIAEKDPKKKEAKVITESGAEVENKVKTNVVNFANIVTIEIDGEVYKVKD